MAVSFQCMTKSSTIKKKKKKAQEARLCDLDGWNGGGRGVGMAGRPKREGVYVNLQLIHFTVPRELTKHCETTMHACVLSCV